MAACSILYYTGLYGYVGFTLGKSRIFDWVEGPNENFHILTKLKRRQNLLSYSESGERISI